MKIAMGADHAGYSLKAQLVTYLRNQGHTIIDLGTDNPNDAKDYPDYAQAVAQKMHDGAAERGIIVCGSGVGVCIAANKIPGIYAAMCHDIYSACQGVEHDNMNVLCLGSKIVAPALAQDLVDGFLSAQFLTEQERYVRRHNKVRAIERKSIDEN